MAYEVTDVNKTEQLREILHVLDSTTTIKIDKDILNGFFSAHNS